MKNLTKILGLLSLVLMVSCGSKSTSMQDLGSCINGNKEVCKELGDDTPPTPTTPEVEEVEFLVENFSTIKLRSDVNALHFSEAGEENGVKFNKFKLEGSETGSQTITFVELTIFENGTGHDKIIFKGRTYTNNYSWSISSDTFFLGTAPKTVTLVK